MEPTSHAVAPAADRAVELRLPADLRCQLIFRMRRTRPSGVVPRTDVDFRFCAGLASFIGVAGSLRRTVGMMEWLKAFARVVAGRGFYCVLRDGAMLHRGWTSVGYCRHYAVGGDEVVIGPIWSAPEARNLGVAMYATSRAIDELVARGASVFYIDTAQDNHACLKMIANCGFGAPVGCMPRAAEPY